MDEYSYACGNSPSVGDLIEFGSRHKRFIVTSIEDETDGYTLHCGNWAFDKMSLKLMVLIARHGVPAT